MDTRCARGPRAILPRGPVTRPRWIPPVIGSSHTECACRSELIEAQPRPNTAEVSGVARSSSEANASSQQTRKSLRALWKPDPGDCALRDHREPDCRFNTTNGSVRWMTAQGRVRSPLRTPSTSVSALEPTSNSLLDRDQSRRLWMRTICWTKDRRNGQKRQRKQTARCKA